MLLAIDCLTVTEEHDIWQLLHVVSIMGEMNNHVQNVLRELARLAGQGRVFSNPAATYRFPSAPRTCREMPFGAMLHI